MKTRLLLLILCFLSMSGFSTNQVKDRLYWNNDTLYLYESPVELLGGITVFWDEMEHGKLIISSDCWNGYFAEWTLIDNQLYLLNIIECNSGINLNEEFAKTYKRVFRDGKLKADWVKGSYWCGKDYAPVQTIYMSIFEHEYHISFEKGVTTNIEEHNFLDCDYRTEDELRAFVFSNIEWDSFPRVDDDYYAEFRFYIEPNENGKVDRVSVKYSSDRFFVQDLIIAIRKLPCFTTYFHEGKFWSVGQNIQIVINRENIKKYVR